MTIVSIVVGQQQRYIGHRPKSKFRPRPEWFGDMKPDAVMNEEQHPVIAIDPNNSPFQDFILEDYEIAESGSSSDEPGKFPRMIPNEMFVFQNVCPSLVKNRVVSQDPRFDQNYEYIPNSFQEILCE